MTTHARNGAADVFLLDPTRHADQSPFVASDTLLVGQNRPNTLATCSNPNQQTECHETDEP